MKFIGQTYNTASSLTNGLADGQLTCTYQEMPDIFVQLRQYFVTQGIEKQDRLVLECENSVPGAIVLLFLLEEGYHFLLIPKIRKTAQMTTAPLPLPTFCQYALTLEDMQNATATSLPKPDQFLRIVKNDRWNEAHRLSDADPKLYLRTSGSTGVPKMAVHSHAKLLGNGLTCVERLGWRSEDRFALPVPIVHMFGLGVGFLPGVAVQASLDLQKGANLLRYLQREREFNPNVALTTPIFCETLLKGRKSPRPYRLTVSAGDRFRGDTLMRYEALFGCLVNLYGSTEMGAVAASRPEDPLEMRAHTVGQPMSGVHMRIEVGAVSSTGEQQEIGQLWCHHPYGCEGYVDQTGQPTAWNIQEHDGWFCTRDLGQIRADGRIVVFGRCDHSINRDGLLVFFADVEKAMEKIDGLETAVVVSRGESQRGQGLIAYCVLTKGVNLTETDIRTACFNLLPRRALPDAIILLDALPLLPNGKVDRQQLIGMAENIAEP